LFADTLDFLRGVHLLNEDALLLQDVDNDGHVDLTWIDLDTDAVMTMYGRGNRRFDSARNVYPAHGVTAIQVANIKSTRRQDLVLTNGSRGSITIVFDPFK
jgi:hypothetical protein